MAKETLIQRIALDGGRDIKAELTSLGTDGERAFKKLKAAADQGGDFGGRLTIALDRIKSKLHEVTGRTQVFGSALRSLAGLVVGVLGVREIISATGAWTDLTSRVQFAIAPHENATEVMDRLRQMSRRTFSSLELTAEGWLRNTQTLKALGLSTQVQLDFQEALNNALVVSGVKGERAASVQEALTRAMALGALRGDQLNTVIKTGGRLVQLLADELKISTLELRNAGAAGLITTDVIGGALLKAFETLRAEADAMPGTIEDSIQQLRDGFRSYIGSADAAAGFSGKVAAALLTVADNMDTVVPLVLAFAAAWALVKVGTIVSGLVQMAAVVVTVLIPALVGASVAISPMAIAATAIAVALIGAAAAALYFSGQLDPFIDAVGSALAKLTGLGEASDDAGTAQRKLGDASDAAARRVAEAGQTASGSIDGIASASDNAAGTLEDGFDDAGNSVVDNFADMRREGIASMAAITRAARTAASAVKSVGDGSGEGTNVGTGFSHGGSVHGSGTSTSDSIFARLSDGEYVVRAAAVRKYGVGILEALNRMRLPLSRLRGFSMGGLASSIPPRFSMPAFAEGGSVSKASQPITLNIGGEVFEGLMAPEVVADRLTRYAMTKNIKRAGRTPGWY